MIRSIETGFLQDSNTPAENRNLNWELMCIIMTFSSRISELLSILESLIPHDIGPIPTIAPIAELCSADEITDQFIERFVKAWIVGHFELLEQHREWTIENRSISAAYMEQLDKLLLDPPPEAEYRIFFERTHLSEEEYRKIEYTTGKYMLTARTELMLTATFHTPMLPVTTRIFEPTVLKWMEDVRHALEGKSNKQVWELVRISRDMDLRKGRLPDPNVFSA